MTRMRWYLLGAGLAVASPAVWAVACGGDDASIQEACEHSCECFEQEEPELYEQIYGDGDDCASECASEVSSGSDGESISQGCLDCVASASCDDLFASDGPCEAACDVSDDEGGK